MTDSKISRKLALAIGWPRVVAHPDGIYVREFTDELPKPFDYRDPSVIWPIAEKFNAFPVILSEQCWVAYFGNTNTEAEADTAAKAVALAVIKAKEL